MRLLVLIAMVFGVVGSKTVRANDIRRRIAKLEEDVPRRTSALSLTLRGFVNTGLLAFRSSAFDETDAYLVENTNFVSRMVLSGRVRLSARWSVSSMVELSLMDNLSAALGPEVPCASTRHDFVEQEWPR